MFRLSLLLVERRTFLIVCVLLLLVPACGHGLSQAGPGSGTAPAPTEATTTTVEATTTTSVVVDPVTPPATIDLAYVNAVMVKLNEFQAQTTELMLRSGRVGLDAQRRIRAVYSGQQLELAYEESATIVGHPPADLRRPVGPAITTATVILTATPPCISFRGTDDNSGIVTDPQTSNVAYALVPRDRHVDGSDLDPTPWVIRNGFVATPPLRPKGDPCAT